MPRSNRPEDLAYHCDLLHVPLDTSIIPSITDLLFKMIANERTVLIQAIAGLKLEVNHYKTLLLTEVEVDSKPEKKD